MDFLDSVDTQPESKRASRVRSWYLYEQYKSLEKNQLNAAKRLKNKSYQDSILHRELSERRARRQYSEADSHQSESHIARSIKGDPSRTLFSESTESFFESVCDREDVVSGRGPDGTLSQQSENSAFRDEYKSFDDRVGSDSCNESINSVIEKTNDSKNVANDIKEELEFVKKNIAEIINLQREAEKECIEKYTELCDNISDNESLNSIRNPRCKSATVVDKFSPKYENAIFVVWSKVVSFAYNVMQTNRGNCYYDYSTQLLTAVLACDVLRRGISRMCHILQPYVSPIKFANDESDSSDIDEILTSDDAILKSTHKITAHKCYSRPKLKFIEKPRSSERKYHSEERWQSCKYSFENQLNQKKYCGVSEPCRSVRKLSRNKYLTKEKSLGSYGNKCSCNCECPHLKKAINPIIKLSNYIDMILQEIQD